MSIILKIKRWGWGVGVGFANAMNLIMTAIIKKKVQNSIYVDFIGQYLENNHKLRSSPYNHDSV